MKNYKGSKSIKDMVKQNPNITKSQDIINYLYENDINRINHKVVRLLEKSKTPTTYNNLLKETRRQLAAEWYRDKV